MTRNDANFVPIILTMDNDRKVNGFLYKPQCLIFTGYLTEEYIKTIGWSFEEVLQNPKSEWEQDHATLRAYSYGANEVIDKIREEIEQLPTNYIEIQRRHSVVERDVVELGAVMRIIDKYRE